MALKETRCATDGCLGNVVPNASLQTRPLTRDPDRLRRSDSATLHTLPLGPPVIASLRGPYLAKDSRRVGGAAHGRVQRGAGGRAHGVVGVAAELHTQLLERAPQVFLHDRNQTRHAERERPAQVLRRIGDDGGPQLGDLQEKRRRRWWCGESQTLTF